ARLPAARAPAIAAVRACAVVVNDARLLTVAAGRAVHGSGPVGLADAGRAVGFSGLAVPAAGRAVGCSGFAALAAGRAVGCSGFAAPAAGRAVGCSGFAAVDCSAVFRAWLALRAWAACRFAARAVR